MKIINKLLSAVSAAALTVSAFSAVPSFAEERQSAEDILTDGAFVYEVVDGSYTITKCTATIVTEIPATRNGTTVTAIGDNAFAGCSGISELEIPESIKSIGDNAFYGCTSLKSVTLPKHLTYLGTNVFMGCTMLESVTLPDTITKIPDYTFSMCDHLTEVNLSDDVTSIGNYAFYECTSLEKFKVPKNLKEVGELAFEEWYSIKDIDASANDSFVVEDGMLMDSKKSVIYRGLATLAGDLYIPDTATTVKAGAFSGCVQLTDVFIPDSVTVINDYAFAYCPAIKNIKFPEGLASVGDYAFASAQSLTSIGIPTTVTKIGKFAFSQCTGLEKVILPEGLEEIGDMAFIDCEKLKSISVPQSVKTLGKDVFGKIYVSSEETKNVEGFKMSVYAGSPAKKYAKESEFEYSVVNRDIKTMAFITVICALILAAFVFAGVLIARGRKSPSLGAKRAKKKAEQQAAEDSYEKIIGDTKEKDKK